jgi:hypothetical protein
MTVGLVGLVERLELSDFVSLLELLELLYGSFLRVLIPPMLGGVSASYL